MSREIRFRGKRLDNGVWVYGLPSYNGSSGEISEIEAIEMDENGQVDEYRFIEVDPETVGQYTGLKDRNGKGIYEGDILGIYEGDIFSNHFSSKIFGIVRFGEYISMGDDNHGGHVGFFIDWGSDDMLRKDLAYWVKVSHVIGNVWDNPELLTATK